MLAWRPHLALILAGCGWTATPPPAPGEVALTVHQGAGWSIRVPVGAAVDVAPHRLRVDALDGTFWYDVLRDATPGPPVPYAIANTWGRERCLPMQWDQPVTPADGVWLAGGRCTIGPRRYWVLALVETYGEEALLTGIIASRTQVPYEDLWLLTVRSALSLRAGATPAPPVDADALRARVRSARVDAPAGQLPVPGGGVFSGIVAEELSDILTAHRAADLPERFAPDVEAPDREAAGREGDEEVEGQRDAR